MPSFAAHLAAWCRTRPDADGVGTWGGGNLGECEGVQHVRVPHSRISGRGASSSGWALRLCLAQVSFREATNFFLFFFDNAQTNRVL